MTPVSSRGEIFYHQTWWLFICYLPVSLINRSDSTSVPMSFSGSFQWSCNSWHIRYLLMWPFSFYGIFYFSPWSLNLISLRKIGTIFLLKYVLIKLFFECVRDQCIWIDFSWLQTRFMIFCSEYGGSLATSATQPQPMLWNSIGLSLCAISSARGTKVSLLSMWFLHESGQKREEGQLMGKEANGWFSPVFNTVRISCRTNEVRVEVTAAWFGKVPWRGRPGKWKMCPSSTPSL